LLAFCVSVGRGIVIILTAGAAALFGPALHAENYPSKPITLVAVFGPCSASDTICRVIAQPLGVALKETVIVEDRPGANGALAALYVAHAAADGHTLLMATNSPLSAVPFLMRNVSYDPVKDFTPVTRVGSFTLMLVVNPSVPAKTVKELIEYAKDHPGKLSFASANTSGIVAGETLKHWAEIDMLHVPYKSSPPAIQDVLAGRVSMMFTDLTTGLPHVRSGALRALAVTRLARSSLIPELPTLDEAYRIRYGLMGRYCRSGPYAGSNRNAAQYGVAQDHRQPGYQIDARQSWLRGVFKLTPGVR
jgi:tripartite-type tricarboxylate transporter receptor subunit TctC